jgi:hypothetical protein
MNIRKILISAASGAVVLSLAGFGIASASIPDSSGVIHGCYKATAHGSRAPLGVIDTAGTAGTCPAGQTALTWNQTGPQGATGAAGATGPQGPAGPGTSYYTVTNAVEIGPVPGDEQTVTTECNSGDAVVSGGFAWPGASEQNLPSLEIVASYPTSDGTGWVITGYNGGTAVTADLTAYAVCATQS